MFDGIDMNIWLDDVWRVVEDNRVNYFYSLLLSGKGGKLWGFVLGWEKWYFFFGIGFFVLEVEM